RLPARLRLRAPPGSFAQRPRWLSSHDGAALPDDFAAAPPRPTAVAAALVLDICAGVFERDLVPGPDHARRVRRGPERFGGSPASPRLFRAGGPRAGAFPQRA